jgi:hypothetical protein
MYTYRQNCLKLGNRTEHEEKQVLESSTECLLFENSDSCLDSDIMTGNKRWTYPCACVTGREATIPLFANGRHIVKVKNVENTKKKGKLALLLFRKC